jgi:DNA-binding NtrC family response regulator
MYTDKDYDTGEFNLLKMERNLIVKYLKLCRGKRSTTATILGITERSIYNKMDKHQITKDEYIN